jgi:alpha-L-fucosidase
VSELITNYGPLQVMWFDVPQEFSAQRGLALERFTRALQPDILINDRSGARGDYDTPEQQVGKFQKDRPWESCITIGQQWAWKPDDAMKSLQECLRTLIVCAGGDGNLLLNVGPMPDGRIEPRQVDRLREMGAWLKQHGDSIYSTRGGPFKPGRWGASTHRGRHIYLHVFEWPTNGFVLPPIARKIVSAKVMTGGKARLSQSAEGISIDVPRKDRQEIATVIRLRLDGSAEDLAPVSVGGASLAEGKPATASNVF